MKIEDASSGVGFRVALSPICPRSEKNRRAVERAQAIERCPMRGCGLAGEYAGPVKQEGAGTHRKQRLALARTFADEGDGRGFVDHPARTASAGHQQYVERRALCEADVGCERQTLGATNRAGLGGHEETFVRAVEVFGPYAHEFPRAEQVQFFHAVEDKKAETHVPPPCC